MVSHSVSFTGSSGKLLLCSCPKRNWLTCPLQFGWELGLLHLQEIHLKNAKKIKKWVSYYTSARSLILVLHGCWCYRGPLLHFITLHRHPHSHRGPLRSGASSRTRACLMQRKGHDLCWHTPDKARGPEVAWKKPYLMWPLLIAGMNIGTKCFNFFMLLNPVLHIFSLSMVKHWEIFS